MNDKSLLPPNSTPLERRITESEATPPSGIINTLWNAEKCPAHLLHVLAWAESVDDWDPKWSEDRKRAVIKESRDIHRMKGTPAAIKRALAVRGQPDAELVERFDDGTPRDETSWALYRIILKRPITIDQANAISITIQQVTRNCCHLAGFDFTQATLRHNGFATRNGTYTRGTIT